MINIHIISYLGNLGPSRDIDWTHTFPHFTTKFNIVEADMMQDGINPFMLLSNAS